MVPSEPRIAVGLSDAGDPEAAFAGAAAQAARELGRPCDLAICFAGASYLAEADRLVAAVRTELDPAALIGCGAGGVVGDGRELESGSGVVVWALSAPDATVETHRFEAEPAPDGVRIVGLEDAELGTTLIVLADPYTFSADALLARVNAEHPGLPVLGGLASAADADGAVLFCGDEVLRSGAVACSLSGIDVVPCVSQGATPVGPEMTVTDATGNVIRELASQPAIERLREVVGELDPADQELVASGLMLGVVIDENQPDYERGDFLVRPVVGADEKEGAVAIGEHVRVGQTVRLQVRDGATADLDLREALGLQARALASQGAAGALVFTCNGRGRGMFGVSDHDAGAVEDALGAPAGGFFCAGEIGPVGGRNFLHGFTATIAVFGR